MYNETNLFFIQYLIYGVRRKRLSNLTYDLGFCIGCKKLPVCTFTPLVIPSVLRICFCLIYNLQHMNTTLKKLIGFVMVLSLITSPAFALAKNENENNGNKNKTQKELKKENREEKRENKKDDDDKKNKSTSCFKAWGHLVAAGWIKKNGALTLPTNCIIPFGISKKFSGNNNHGTTTDTVAPAISNIIITTTQTGATIKWTTNESSNSVAYVGTSTPVSTTTATVTDASSVKNHTLTVSGLATSTIYYAIVTSKDNAGNVGTSGVVSFTTLAPAPDTTAPTISGVIATVASTTINGWWATNEPATTRIYYSTTTPITVLSSSFVENTTLVTSHALTVPNLATSTLYYLIFESKDAAGNTQRTDQFSVTTTNGL